MEQSAVIKSMLDNIVSDKSNDAVERFNELMRFKIAAAIEDKKTAVAKSIYNPTEDEPVVAEASRSPYAIGMASAMKSTGDKPPLEKSTIKKAHKIAKAVMREEEQD